MKRLLLFAALFAAISIGYAQNPKFTAVSPSGHTLSFEIYTTGKAWVTCMTSHGSVHFSNAVAYPNLSGDVIIPDSVLYNGTMYPVDAIGSYAFSRCQNISSITFPHTITWFDYNSFLDVGHIDSIIVLSDNPPTIGDSYFQSATANATVFLPSCSCLQSYLSEWGSTYNFRCPIIFNISISSNDSTWGVGSYIGLDDSIAEVTATANYGYHFDHWSYGSTTNPDTLLLSSDVTITAIFAKNQYAVTGTANDNTNGTVCGSTTVDYLDSVTLTAMPNYGYHFDHWNDGNTDNPRQIVVTDVINFIAFFQKEQYALTTTVEDTLRGSVSSVGNEATLDYSNLSLNGFTQMTSDSIAPAGDNYFRYVLTRSITNGTNWYCYYTFESEDGSMSWFFTPRCTGRDALGYQSLSSNNNELFTNTTIGNTIVYGNLRGVSITYSNLGWVIEFPVDVHCTHRQTNAAYSSVYWGNHLGYGYRNGDTLYADYLNEITIEAIPTYGYLFSHWQDGDTNNPRIITLTRDTSFSAFFGKNIYAITAISGDTIKGSVTGSTSIEYLDSVTIVAVPNYGYHFTQWIDGDTNRSRTIIVLCDSSFTAQFDYNQYSVVLNVDTSIHGNCVGSGSYNYLSSRTIQANVNYGYHFTHWNDGVSSNPRTFTLTKDTSFTAYYSPNQYSVIGQANDSIRGVVEGSATVDYLDSVTLEAIPNYGYHFVRWNDNNTDNPRTLIATGNISKTAVFAYNQYSITLGVDTSIHGNCTGGGNYNYLSNRTIRANANHGYHFTHWNDGDTNNPRTFILIQDTTFKAFYAPNQYSIIGQTNDSIKGVVEGSATVDYLDSVTLEAISNYGYHFVRWSDNNTNNPRTVVATNNINLTAIFDYNSYTITLSVDTNIHGIVSGEGTYNYLAERTITATSNYGYHFIHWQDGDTNNPRTITLTQDTSFTAFFAPNQYTLTVMAGEHGTVSEGGIYDFGDTIAVEAFPEPHYHFLRWDDGNTDNPRQVIIAEDDTITASFALDTHTVRVESNDISRGMVEASGTEFVYGAPCTVTATPYSGYIFVGWNDGTDHNPYTFAVVCDTVLRAKFLTEEEYDGIDGIEDLNAKVYSIHGQIVVEGAEGYPVTLYDITGRQVRGEMKKENGEIIFAVPTSGVYLVKVGDYPARKVVVIR